MVLSLILCRHTLLALLRRLDHNNLVPSRGTFWHKGPGPRLGIVWSSVARPEYTWLLHRRTWCWRWRPCGPNLERTSFKVKIPGVSSISQRLWKLFETELSIVEIRSHRIEEASYMLPGVSFASIKLLELGLVILQRILFCNLFVRIRWLQVERYWCSRGSLRSFLNTVYISTFVKYTVGSSDLPACRLVVDKLSTLVGMTPWIGSWRTGSAIGEADRRLGLEYFDYQQSAQGPHGSALDLVIVMKELHSMAELLEEDGLPKQSEQEELCGDEET